MVDLRNLARELEHGAAAAESAMFSRAEATPSFAGNRSEIAGGAVFAGEVEDQRRAA